MRGSSAGACLLILLAASLPARADDDPDARLREQLRRTTIDLRNTEDENAALKAKQAGADRQQQDLTAQIATLKQQLLDAQTKATGEAKTQLDAATGRAAADEQQLDQTRATLAKWQDAYQQAADTARTRDADAKRLTASGAALQSRLDGCVGNNVALYKLGLEILDRYQHKDFGDVLGDAEPFTQLSRVKLENAVQDYQDKLRDQKIAPAKAGG